MIVRMKKIVVISQAGRREATLAALQDLGVMHVQPLEKPFAASAAEVEQQLQRLVRATALLAAAQGPPSATRITEQPWQNVVADAIRFDEQREQTRDTRADLSQQIEDLAIWGAFDPQSIAALAARGINVKLYRCAPQSVPAPPAGCAFHEVYRDTHTVAFVAVSQARIVLLIPEVQLPEESSAHLAARAQACEQELVELEQRLAALQPLLPRLQAAHALLTDDLARAHARDHVTDAGMLCYLQGFCPFDTLAQIEAAAHAHGWGLLSEDPGAGDAVPTLLRNPRWLRPVETVFNFINTFPGYQERDISPVFYLFFSLFYAMLIGDACYGAIYLIALIAVHAWKGARIPTQPLYLLYVLNIATIIWGVLTGSYFGVLPNVALLRALKILDTGTTPLMMSVCFTIAALHITVAHVWNALRMLNSWKCVAELGRIMMTWGAFFLARALLLGHPFPPVMLWVGGTGIALALVFSGALTNPADLFQFPFGVINFFGDTVSYLRLFAVGFAGAAVAKSFNDLALGVGFNSIVAGLGAALILICGHCLNLVLGPLGVLVHGLRLNVLEFSGHLGQEWTGTRYHPLARTEAKG